MPTIGSKDPQALGVSHVNNYLVSALPWMSRSTVSPGEWQISFPSVTSFIIVKNHSGSGEVRFSATSNGLAGTNHGVLGAGESFSADYRVTSLFVSASGNVVNVLAGLTQIPTGSFPILTGSDIAFQGVG